MQIMDQEETAQQRPRFRLSDLDREAEYKPRQPHYGLTDKQYKEVFEIYLPLLLSRHRTKRNKTVITIHPEEEDH